MKKIIFAAMIISLLVSSVCYADEVDDLFGYYVKRFKPEKADLVISGKPDKTGKFQDIYMNLEGVMIETLRVNRLAFRMRDVQFNEPSEWKKGNVECTDALKIEAIGEIFEEDINKAIQAKTFGDDGDTWHDLSLKITPKGLSGKGYYKAKVAFIKLDILLEITSKLKIVKGTELWLDNPFVKVNTLDVPDYVTNKALAQIQPLVDLKRVSLPMTLHKVDLKNGVATLSSRTLPKPLTQGIKYRYPK